MRLAGIEKGGYYPYPPHMAEVTASWFTPLPAGICGRLLDPCAGEGEVASLLGRLLDCETWGCELFPYCAEKATARMDKCHSAAWESCSLTDEAVTLLWCNPPYDDDRPSSHSVSYIRQKSPATCPASTSASPSCVSRSASTSASSKCCFWQCGGSSTTPPPTKR